MSKLLAINTTTDFPLLTDMDILKGAKQNRVVNTSVLIAPNSKSELDVSCVERFRWTYTSPSFKMSPQAMDYNIRAAKAAGLGKIKRIKNEKIPGFGLSYDGQIIHMAAFTKNAE